MSSPRLFKPALLAAAALALALVGAARPQDERQEPAPAPEESMPASTAPPAPAPAASPALQPTTAPQPASAPASASAAQPASTPSAAEAAPPAASGTTVETVTTTTITTTTVQHGPAPAVTPSAPAAPTLAPPPAVHPLPPGAALPPVAPANAPMLARNNPRDQLIRDARDAFARHDRNRLAALRAEALSTRHALAQWVDYWDLSQRITEVNPDEVDAFLARWPGTYVEDRLRNDWLLELGRRRDWGEFSRHYPRFRMNDDREVTCYATLIDHLGGKDVRTAARAAWFAQRDIDDGCQLLAQTMYDDKAFTDEDIIRRLRQAAEFGRQRAARGAAQILGKPTLKALNELWDNPAHFLTARGSIGTTRRSDLVTLALARMAANDAGAAALQMSERWDSTLDRSDAAWTWAMIAKHGAQSLMPDAVEWADHAWTALKPRKGVASDRPDWGDDALDWHARAAVRAASGPGAAQHWRDLLRAIDAMSPANRGTEAWVYWRARAQLALAKDNAEGDATRAEAHATLNALSTSLSFYGLLAAEDLGISIAFPPRPAAITSAERGAARALPGLQRALALASLEIRDEARREWNYTLRGMDDRQLLAAAQWACEVGDWQLCINTSERTRGEIDMMQRYPMPYQRDIATAAQAVGLEPAFVFGLIRQETRFMPQLRSYVGASGLMQIMPSTARWAAKKSGIPYSGDQIADPQTNLRLGTFYLKLVLDSFGSSEPMAAAAYNAGPARSRRWRGTAMLDPAVWTENVPFYETRDYVKKVMTNAAIYAALKSGQPPTLRPRLGPQIGPRDAEQPTQDLP